jgi:uncharacterized repeat protein (TIGR03847 family)
VSVALEKSQVQILADRMDDLLDEVAGRAGAVIPPDADVDDLEPLTPPVDEEFRVAAMGLAWDGTAEAVVVEAVAASDEPIDEDAILSDSEEGPHGRPRVRGAGSPGGGRRAAVLPAVLAAARPDGPRLPPAERLPPLTAAAP